MTTFAEKQLQNQGWSKGEGLGKNKKGIKKAITGVKKNDVKGVGAKNDYEFAWWDHVYNKVSSTVKVDNENGEIVVKSTEEENIEKNKMGIISIERPTGRAKKEDTKEENKDPERVLNQEQINMKNALYGYFVKSNTSGFQVEDFTTKISDEALFEACGRLTARKGARAEQVGKLDRTHNDKSSKSTMIAKVDSEEEIETVDIEKSEKDKKDKKNKKEKKEKKDKKDKKDDKETDNDKKKVKRKSEDKDSKKKKDKKSKKE